MVKRQYILVCAALAAAATFGWAGRGIAFASQWGFFEALRTTSSIVLAIMGAWVTILYPRALESVIQDPLGEVAVQNKDRISALLLPVKLSTGVLLVVLLIGPFSLLLKQWPIVLEYLSWMRGISFGVLVLLTLAEIAAVVLTIWPIQAAKSEIDGTYAKKSAHASLFRLVQKR